MDECPPMYKQSPSGTSTRSSQSNWWSYRYGGFFHVYQRLYTAYGSSGNIEVGGASGAVGCGGQGAMARQNYGSAGAGGSGGSGYVVIMEYHKMETTGKYVF